jgi:hypothetical protein
MRNASLATALVIAIFVVATPRAAHADCRGNPCPAWLDAMGYTLAAGIVAGYGYGTGTFIYRDMTQDAQSLDYGVTEASANTLLASVFAAGTIDAARNGSGSTVLWGTMTALHTTLAVHGIWRISQNAADIRVPTVPAVWIGGSVYGLTTLYFVSEIPANHGRAFGVTEAAVNAPLAIGLGYLAVDRFQNDRGGPGLLYGGMAAVSGALAVHGIRTAVSPHKPPGLDLLGTDITPTVVDDGHEVAPGIGASGTW